MLGTNLKTVFIPGWNDWNGGAVIEPAVEFADGYLATGKYIACFKRVPELAAVEDMKSDIETDLVRQIRRDGSGRGAVD